MNKSTLPLPSGKKKTDHRIRELQRSTNANSVNRSSGTMYRTGQNGTVFYSQQVVAFAAAGAGAVWL